MKPKIISLYVITRRFDPWNHVKPTRNSNIFWEGSSLPELHSVTFSTGEDRWFKKITIHNQPDPPPMVEISFAQTIYCLQKHVWMHTIHHFCHFLYIAIIYSMCPRHFIKILEFSSIEPWRYEFSNTVTLFKEIYVVHPTALLDLILVFMPTRRVKLHRFASNFLETSYHVFS
jgi:hypothetical protein